MLARLFKGSYRSIEKFGGSDTASPPDLSFRISLHVPSCCLSENREGAMTPAGKTWMETQLKGIIFQQVR